MKNECPLLAKEKGKGQGGEASDVKKGKAKFRRSFKRGMLAAFGASDAEELSSSEGSSTDSDGFKNGTCFMAIEDDKVTSTPSPSDNEDEFEFYIGEQGFHTLEEAHSFLFDVVDQLTAKMIKTKKKVKRLNESFESEQREKNEMTIKFFEMKAIVDSYDSTLFDSMEIDFGKAKEELAILELINSNLVKEKEESFLLNSLLNDELSSLNEKVVNYESNVVRLESKVSSLEKGKACESSIASVSPSCEVNLLNEKLKFIEIENLKLKEIISKFTRSQASLNEIICGVGSNSNKHGLGYKSSLGDPTKSC